MAKTNKNLKKAFHLIGIPTSPKIDSASIKKKGGNVADKGACMAGLT